MRDTLLRRQAVLATCGKQRRYTVSEAMADCLEEARSIAKVLTGRERCRLVGSHRMADLAAPVLECILAEDCWWRLPREEVRITTCMGTGNRVLSCSEYQVG